MTLEKLFWKAGWFVVFLFATAVYAIETDLSDKAGKNPADELPPHITRLTWFGERADWSHDGKKILFLGQDIRRCL